MLSSMKLPKIATYKWFSLPWHNTALTTQSKYTHTKNTTLHQMFQMNVMILTTNVYTSHYTCIN